MCPVGCRGDSPDFVFMCKDTKKNRDCSNILQFFLLLFPMNNYFGINFADIDKSTYLCRHINHTP